MPGCGDFTRAGAKCKRFEWEVSLTHNCQRGTSPTLCGPILLEMLKRRWNTEKTSWNISRKKCNNKGRCQLLQQRTFGIGYEERRCDNCEYFSDIGSIVVRDISSWGWAAACKEGVKVRRRTSLHYCQRWLHCMHNPSSDEPICDEIVTRPDDIIGFHSFEPRRKYH